MSVTNYQTPGVYINEVNAFPNSVVPVPTAVPAFIGYTPQAEYQGQSYTNVPQKVTSFAEFQAFYMLPDPNPPAPPAVQYSPDYYLIAQSAQPTKGKYVKVAGTYYSILPDPNTIYYMYNSIRLFFQNGGGEAYIVSVGSYGAPSGKPVEAPGDAVVNPNVKKDDLMAGLALLKNEVEPTMYICPEATLLSVAENGTVMQSMLLQAQEMGTSVCIFDVIGGDDPDPILYTEDIQTFRDNTGTQGLKYGTCYYPFVITTVTSSGELTYQNLFGGDVKQLEPILNPPSQPDPTTASILTKIEGAGNDPTVVAQYNAALTNSSQTYNNIMTQVLGIVNTLPPSGGMAGVYAINDNSGVWNSPANVSMVGVSDLPIRLSNQQQENLNVDFVSGKSINAIRYFIGQGVIIWGARTLDGNSQDWRYVSVRRTMTFLEQSCKAAARAYVFEPNDQNTWTAVQSMISSFLNGVWKDGGLQGAAAKDAYQVSVGLGSTMTGEDVLNGLMKVSIQVAVVRPAEFIELTFMQKMATSG